MIDDRELLRALAQACGWTCTPGRVFTTDGYWVTDKEDSVKGASFGHTPDEAWDHAEFPDWLHSVDAALGLPWPFGDPATEYELVIRIHDGKPCVDFIQHRWTVDEHGADYDDWALIAQSSEEPLARALCETFYLWFKSVV